MVPVLHGFDSKVTPGAEQFAKLGADAQLKILGPAKWAAWKDGKVTLDENLVTGIVGRRHDPVWGSMRYERSLREILGREAAKGYRLLGASGITRPIHLQLHLPGTTILGKTSPKVRSIFRNHPERAVFTSKIVHLYEKQKLHILSKHADQVEWLESHTLAVLKALESPDFISSEPVRNKGHWALTHILGINEEDYQFLVAGIQYGKINDNHHKIITIFQAGRLFVFDEKGNLRPKWIPLK